MFALLKGSAWYVAGALALVLIAALGMLRAAYMERGELVERNKVVAAALKQQSTENERLRAERAALLGRMAEHDTERSRLRAELDARRASLARLRASDAKVDAMGECAVPRVLAERLRANAGHGDAHGGAGDAARVAGGDSGAGSGRDQ